MNCITDLMRIVEQLPDDQKTLFNKLFYVSSNKGFLKIPKSFYDKVQTYFAWPNETIEDTVKRISTQTIIKTLNKYTFEGALFNELRACKPGNREDDINIKNLWDRVLKYLEDDLNENGCDLCEPEKYTSEDTFGRLKENGHITIANAAKYDAANGMVVFKNHNPLEFDNNDFSDWMKLANKWFIEMYKENKDFIYPFLIWNCLPRAGASQMHGHMHVLLTKDFPYSGVEKLRIANLKYMQDNPWRNYFTDLISVHKSLKLCFYFKRVYIFTYLTPTKDKETFIIAKKYEDLIIPLFKVIRCFIDKLGVFAFNLGIQMPPISAVAKNPEWQDFPYIARVVDRGNPLKHGTDFAGMELYGSKVIGSDPFKVADTLQDYMKLKKS